MSNVDHITTDPASFDVWWENLNRLAASKGQQVLLSPAQEDHREGFESGNTIHDELSDMEEAARSSL